MFARTYMRPAALTLVTALLLLVVLTPALALAQQSTAPGSVPPSPNLIGECKIGWGINADLSGCFPLAVIWLASWFLAFCGGVLRLAGLIFDTLIEWVVINFRGMLETLKILGAVDLGWTAFRDFTNILIIGLFVFIAITIILGVKKFESKSLIARVLIIAVLLNFSLLFTKIIIDGSNFVAYQIYRQMAGQEAAGGTVNFDVSSAFLLPMGITSVWDSSYPVMKKYGENSGLFAGISFGIIGGLLLLGVAAVFLYGCFLIASRAILLIFLMLTSALAFATYLLPPLAKSEYGWEAWWKTLINAAIFAPLLMLFLWISLVIIQRAGLERSGTFGSVITNPQSQIGENGWTTILVYILSIGLMYVSLRLSHKLAGSISGISLSGMALAAPLGLAGGALGMLRHARLSKAAFRAERGATRGIKETRARVLSGSLSADEGARAIDKLRRDRDKARSRMGKDFNFMNSSFAKKVAGVAGLSGALAGQTKSKTYADQVKEGAKAAIESTAGTKVSQKDQQKMIAEAIKNVDNSDDVKKLAAERDKAQQAHEEQKETSKQLRESAQEQRKIAQQQLETTQNAASQQKQLLEKQLRKSAEQSAGGRYDKELSEIKEALKQDAEALAANAGGPGSSERRNKITANEARERVLMQERQEAIAKAHETVNQQLESEFAQIDQNLKLDELRKAVEEHEASLREMDTKDAESLKAAKAAHKAYEKKREELVTAATESLTARARDFNAALDKSLRSEHGGDVAGEVLKKSEEEAKNKRIREILTEVSEKSDEEKKT